MITDRIEAKHFEQLLWVTDETSSLVLRGSEVQVERENNPNSYHINAYYLCSNAWKVVLKNLQSISTCFFVFFLLDL